MRCEVFWQVRAYVREQYGIKGKRHYNPDQLRLDVKNIPDAPSLSILERSQLIDWDFQTQSLTTGSHPLTLHRAELNLLGVLSIVHLKTRKAGRIARVGGSVISRQRPPTAKGMCFIILQR